MVGALLLRGMLAGAVAGLLCFAFLQLVGERPIDEAIAFEEHLQAKKAHAGSHAPAAKDGPASPKEGDTDLVSRAVQAGVGLFTAVVIYSAAFGGLFALAFALAYGRMADLDVRATSAVLAALGFVAVSVIPALKYPANPPSVGDAETLATRTALFLGMIALSLAAMTAAGMLRTRLRTRFGGWNAFLIAAAAYLVIIVGVSFASPSVHEVPEQFPAIVLWQFRIASLGGQLVIWATLGLVFGGLTQRAALAGGGSRYQPIAL